MFWTQQFFLRDAQTLFIATAWNNPLNLYNCSVGCTGADREHEGATGQDRGGCDNFYVNGEIISSVSVYLCNTHTVSASFGLSTVLCQHCTVCVFVYTEFISVFFFSSGSSTVRATSGPVFKGVCKNFSRSQGHGYIKPANGGEDIFVHISEWVDNAGDQAKMTVKWAWFPFYVPFFC